nr:serine/arginine repetitive matrix protein 2-like [Ipomoea batatas]
MEYKWKLLIPRVWSTRYTKHTFPARTRALTDMASKISSEFYDYFIFRLPKTTRTRGLRPLIIAELRNMVLDKGFVTAPSTPRPSWMKISLGSKKTAEEAKNASDPAEQTAPTTVPTKAVARGKEKAAGPEVEEVIPLKRTKRSSSRSSEQLDVLRDRDDSAGALLDQIRDRVPSLDAIMNWPTDQLGEQIAEDILRWAFTSGRRAMQAEVRTALTHGIEEDDLPAVLDLLLDEVADPGPKPYTN